MKLSMPNEVIKQVHRLTMWWQHYCTYVGGHVVENDYKKLSQGHTIHKGLSRNHTNYRSGW